MFKAFETKMNNVIKNRDSFGSPIKPINGIKTFRDCSYNKGRKKDSFLSCLENSKKGWKCYLIGVKMVAI